MSPIPSARTPGGRARVHIKALIEEAKHQVENSPMPAQMFFSGMLSGLAAALEILNGGDAEGSMETIVQKMSAAIGQAYLDGQLPPQTPVPDAPDLQARAEQAEAGRLAADNMLRAVCDVFGGPHQDPIVKGRETLARAEQAEAAIECMRHGAHLCGDCRVNVTAVLDGQLPQTPTPDNSVDREIAAGVQRCDEAAALYERWVKAGPPPLGTSMARWWDARLAEFHNAIHDPPQETP